MSLPQSPRSGYDVTFGSVELPHQRFKDGFAILASSLFMTMQLPRRNKAVLPSKRMELTTMSEGWNARNKGRGTDSCYYSYQRS